VVVNSNELEKEPPGNNTDLIGCFKTFPIETINQKYFPFTTRPYTVMKYEDLWQLPNKIVYHISKGKV